MDLEYFYQLMQLFGVLLGLIGIYIVFKIQSLDISISSYRNNLVKSIALYRASKDRVPCEAKIIDDERCKRTFDELVHYHCLIVDGGLDKNLRKWAKQIIEDKDLNNNLPKDYVEGTWGDWENKHKERDKIIRSMRYPIISTAGIILFALYIITSNSFEIVNDIFEASNASKETLVFIVYAFLNIIFISIYILINLPKSESQ